MRACWCTLGGTAACRHCQNHTIDLPLRDSQILPTFIPPYKVEQKPIKLYTWSTS